MTTERQKALLIKGLFYLGVGIASYFGIKLLVGVLWPFAVAGIITVSLQGVINRLVDKFKMKRRPASVALVLTVYISVIVLSVYLVRALYMQLTELLAQLPRYADSISATVNAVTKKVSQFFGEMPDFGNGFLEDIPTVALKTVAESLAASVTGAVTDIASGIPQFILSLAVMIIAGVYIAKDYGEISAFITGILPPDTTEKLIFIKDQILKKLAKLLRGYLIIIIMTFVELTVGLSVLGVKYALVISAITAVVDILPVLGTGTVLIPWAVFAGLSGNPIRAVGFMVLYIIMTAVRNITEPKIIGSNIGVHPVLTLGAIFLGLRLFGAMGVLLAPITAIVLKSIYDARQGQLKVKA